MKLLRCGAACTAPFLFGLLAASAAAQPSAAALVAPAGPGAEPLASQPRMLEFRSPEGDLRRPGEPRRNGLIAAFPLRENVQIGIGRFAVPELARPRTNMEAERHPTSVRPRDRGIAAVGVSLRF